MADAVFIITPAKVDGGISVIRMVITPHPLGRKWGARCMNISISRGRAFCIKYILLSFPEIQKAPDFCFQEKVKNRRLEECLLPIDLWDVVLLERGRRFF